MRGLKEMFLVATTMYSLLFALIPIVIWYQPHEKFNTEFLLILSATGWTIVAVLSIISIFRRKKK